MKYILKQEDGYNNESLARAAIERGMYLYGYCNGMFGRDSYGKKLILEVMSNHVIVLEDGHTILGAEMDGKIFTWAALIESSNKTFEEDWKNG